MVTFLVPRAWLLYLASGLLGVGAAILWTGQGNFLARCSTPETISRNSGVFWSLLQCSLFFGNLFVYFQFQDKPKIDHGTRLIVIVALTIVAVAGLCLLLTLRHEKDNSQESEENATTRNSALVEAWKALYNALKLFITRDMLLLSFTFFYTGKK